MKLKAEHIMKNISPTSGNIHAYLTDSWSSRSRFNIRQRAGFAQFIFLMLCSHLEEILYSLLNNRYEALAFLGHASAPVRTIKHGIQTIGTTATKIDDGNHSVVSSDAKAVSLSLIKLMEQKRKNILKQPIDKLIESYNEIFPVSFEQVLGPANFQDISTVRNLRNIFSHGRAIELCFFGPLGGAAKPDFDSFTLKSAIESLKRAKIIVDLNKYNGNNHNEISELIFSDASLLHFYAATQEASELLRNSAVCPYEIVQMGLIARLPTLSPY
jgi:hypothetical protein